MKYQQVSVDFANMVFTAFSYMALAGAAWIFLRLLQACFWLPRHLRKQNDVQQMLQEKVDSYEKYLAECEEREKNEEMENGEEKEKSEENEEISESEEARKDPDEKSATNARVDNRSNEEKWKERRECLQMLKRELKRVQDGGDIYDWDYLLEEEDKLEEEQEEKDNDGEKTNNEAAGETSEETPKDLITLEDIDCEKIIENEAKYVEEKKKEK